MSEIRVEVVEIEAIHPHPKADRLEIARIKGWHCVVGKGQFQAGDRAVYFPIDAVLPPDLEATLFPPDAKIKLDKGRIRTIKIRGMVSQGLLVSPSSVGMTHAPVGTNGTKALGVTKYEPSMSTMPKQMMPSAARHRNPHFKEYTDIENAKNFHNLFDPGELVVATEKIHGTNFRAGYAPYVPYHWYEKLWSFFFPNRVPKFEFVYGSRRVQLQKKSYKGFYAENVYGKMVTQWNLDGLIPPGYIIYGEIYGDGIQKGYTYGLGPNEHDFVVIEILDTSTGCYLDFSEVEKFCQERNLPLVPVLYKGPFNWDDIWKITLGPSVLSPTQKVREGVVVRNQHVQDSKYGRKILKFVSDEYLLKDNTDFH